MTTETFSASSAFRMCASSSSSVLHLHERRCRLMTPKRASMSSCVFPTGLRATTVFPRTPIFTRFVMCANVICPQFVPTPSSCTRTFVGKYLRSPDS